MFTKISLRLINWFLSGLLLVVPLALTGYFMYWVFTQLDGIFGLDKPGLGILLLFIAITIIGFLSSQILAKQLWQLLENLLTRAPLIKLIYTSIKDLLEAFVGEKKRFRYPVKVKMSEAGIYKIGFITQENLNQIALPNMVAVYFPHSYNFSGNLFLVDKQKIEPIQANSTEVMKFIVSGGVSQFGSEKV